MTRICRTASVFGPLQPGIVLWKIEMASDPLSHFQHLVIYSPHFDDAFVSLGGYLGYCYRFKRISVVIIFGRSNRIYKQDVSGELIEHASEMRASEEARNIRRINAELIIFSNEEAVLRGYRRRNDGTGGYPIEVDDMLDAATRETVYAQISAMVLHHRDALHLFPLGIGGHVDHVLVRDVTVREPTLESSIAYYEDLPYAFRPNANMDFAFEMSSLLLPVDVGAKVAFVRSYKSQQATKWVDGILSYMSSIGGLPGSHSERIWLPMRD